MDDLTPVRRWTKWTNEEHRRLAELVQAGRSNREIGRELGRSADVVNVKKRQLGLTRRSQVSCMCDAPLVQRHTGRPSRYCSDGCSRESEAAKRADLRSRRHAEAVAARVDWICLCGVRISEDDPSRKYCSKKCSQRAWYLRTRPTDQSAARPSPEERLAVRREALARRIVEWVTANPGMTKHGIDGNVRGRSQEIRMMVDRLHADGELSGLMASRGMVYFIMRSDRSK